MSMGRPRVMLIDADNHTYNDKYRYLLGEIILNFGEIINLMFEKPEAVNHDECQSLIQDIRDLINHAPPKSWEENFQKFKPPLFTIGDTLCETIPLILSKTFSPLIRYLKKLEPSLTDDVFFQANGQLTAQINDAKEKGHRVILVSGSSRNCLLLDLKGAETNGTGLFCHDLTKYAERLGVEVAPFSMADIEGNLPLGESYRRMLGEDFLEMVEKGKFNFEHQEATFDINKMATFIAAGQYVECLYPQAEVEFYDDLGEMLTALHNTLHKGKGSPLLPQGPTFRLFHYEGAKDRYRLVSEFSGTGRVEPNYCFYVNRMIKMSPVDEHGSIDPATTLDIDKFIQQVYSPSIGTRLTQSLLYYPKAAASAIANTEMKCVVM